MKARVSARIAQRVSNYNRDRKWRMFMSEFSPGEAERVLDVGFTAEEYSKSDNYIEKHYPHPHRLTALGVDDSQEVARRYPASRFVSYKGGRFPFNDGEFDICWSNAVLEHVGDENHQVEFLREIARVSHSAFLTTPNRFFPIETHTNTPLLHWLPKSVFDRYLALVGKSWAAGDYMALLSRRDLERRLSAAQIADYQIFENTLFGVCLDFVVVIRGS